MRSSLELIQEEIKQIGNDKPGEDPEYETRVDKAKEASPRFSKIYDEVEEIRKKILELGELPAYAELNQAYEGGKRDEKADLVRAGMTAAFKKSEITQLGTAIECKPWDTMDSVLTRTTFAQDTPQIFFKQITEERITKSGLLGIGKKTEPFKTNEVLVVARMNDDYYDNTVFVAVVEVNNEGKPNFSKNPSVFGLYTESEYKRIVRDNNPIDKDAALVKKSIAGEVTVAGYNKTFKKIHKITPEEWWEKHDRDIDTYGGPESWNSKEVRQKVMDQLTGAYEPLLPELNEIIANGLEETERNVKEEEEKRNIWFIDALKAIYKSADGDPGQQNAIKRKIIDETGISEAEFDKYLG